MRKRDLNGAIPSREKKGGVSWKKGAGRTLTRGYVGPGASSYGMGYVDNMEVWGDP